MANHFNEAGQDAFYTRVEKYRAEIEKLLYSLYGKNSPKEAFFNSLVACNKNRSPYLRNLDNKRAIDNQWYLSRTSIGMTMYTNLFNGTFKGIEDKIPYLNELGITYLHLMPIMKTPEPDNDGGYAVDSYLDTNPSLGSIDDFRNLAIKLHESGISICLDFVMNHTSSTHEWAEKAKNGDEEYIEYYQTFDDRTIPDEYEKTVPEVFPSTAPGNFVWSDELKKWVLSSFYPYQWDLNYHNPRVLIEMISNMLRLANMGVDVFRLDAVPYIWKELGTSCRNLPQVHSILRLFRIALEIAAPSCILKGEVVMAPSELASYFGTPEAPECHLLYDVPMMVNIWSSIASQDARLMMRQYERILSLSPNCSFINYARCHDDIGWGLDESDERDLGIDPLLHKIFLYRFYDGEFLGSYARGELYNYDDQSKDARSCGTCASLCGLESASSAEEKKKAISRIMLAYGTIWAMKGIPMINSGDEIGQLNDYSFHEDMKRCSDSRNVHRSKFDWNKAKKRNISGTSENTIWKMLASFREARNSLCLFDNDAYISTWQSGNDHVFSIRRKKDNDDMLCISNFSDKQEFIKFAYFVGEYKDIFSGKTVYPGLGFWIEPLSVMWILQKTN